MSRVLATSTTFLRSPPADRLVGLGLPDLAMEEDLAGGREISLLRAGKTLSHGNFTIGSWHGQVNE
jgi:hypothetical protein